MYRTEETVGVGGSAPDFSLKDSSGNDVKLSGYRGRVNVLLVFYRGGADPYSIQWLSRLNDDYLYFRGLETEILAISPDNVKKAADTATRHKLSFRLLSDPQKAVIRKYGVFNELENGDNASIFIVDRSGTIRYRHVGMVPGELPSNDKLMEIIRSMA